MDKGRTGHRKAGKKKIKNRTGEHPHNRGHEKKNLKQCDF